MSPSDDPLGWAWFDRPAQTDDNDPAQAFARCFATPDGRRVLAHLRAATIGRTLGHEASDNALRHLEGQRQLVHAITALIRRGLEENRRS